MIKNHMTDECSDPETLRPVANYLTNGLIDQLDDILRHSAQENLRGAQKCGKTAFDLMQAAEVLGTVQVYLSMTCRRLQRIASLMQLREGSGGAPGYLQLCDREGLGCDCETVCKHKPKHLHSEGEKAFGDAERQSRQFFQNQPPNG